MSLAEEVIVCTVFFLVLRLEHREVFETPGSAQFLFGRVLALLDDGSSWCGIQIRT